MRKIIYLTGHLLLSGILCLSCTEKPDDPPGSGIVLEGNTRTELVVFADNKRVDDGGIKFTTDGPWEAIVEAVATRTEAGKTADWVVLSQYRGERAGSYTITLTLKQNFSGQSRKAVIRITCGEAEIIITVEQKADKENGKKLKRVKSITYREQYGKGYREVYGGDESTVTRAYFYDEPGRIAKMVQEEKEGNRRKTDTYLFDYHIVGEITVDCYSSTSYMDGSFADNDQNIKYILALNRQGNVTSIKQIDPHGRNEMKVGYTEDGRLGKIGEEKAEGGDDWYDKFYYTDGLFTKYEFFESGSETEVKEFSVDELYPHRYPADGTNIDFNACLFGFGADDLPELVWHMGLTGKFSDCLLEVGGSGEHDAVAEIVPFYPEPGKIYKESKKEIREREEELYYIKYVFDDEKNVTKFYYEEPYELMRYDYEIHVGYELENPWILEEPHHPEPPRYKYQIKNRKWTKLGDGKNVYTYTVLYE